MIHRNARRSLLAAFLFLVPVAALLYAQDDPEHPGKKATPITKEAIGDAVNRYVARDTELKGGWFLLWDEIAGGPLVLKLDMVHDDKLSALSPELHFACADFKTKDGKKTYDLDFFLQGKSAETLEVSEITIHKEDGAPRYDWSEEGGVWKKKPRATR